jgi:hypothetical protein
VRLVHAELLPKMRVLKDPSCSCCGSWANYLRAEGFVVDVSMSSDMARVKMALGVPENLQSCHTAEIGGYVIEGHVPADAIRRLLSERPKVVGLAVAGMPPSAPGMDTPGATDVYEATAFDASAQSTFARYRALRRIG